MNAIIIPMKNLEYSKQRMFPFLTGSRKKQFVSYMFRDVLNEVIKSDAIDEVFVATSDDVIEKIALEYAVKVIPDHNIKGLNNVIQHAYQAVRKRGYTNIAILPGDIPLISHKEVETIFSDESAITIVPAHDQKGTNTLRIKNRPHFRFLYGDDSFNKHIAQIKTDNLSYVVRTCSGIGFDIDYPSQLNCLLQYNKLSANYLQHDRADLGSHVPPTFASL